MISLNSSSSEPPDKSIAETNDDNAEDDDDDDDDDDDGKSKQTILAAFAAAAWTSRGAREAGRGRECTRSGKLRMAEEPLMLRAATSCALAAISGVENVPSHMRDFLRGSLISDTHLPQFRILTPRYTGCLLESRMRFAVVVVFLEDEDGDGDGDGDVGVDEFEVLSVSELLLCGSIMLIVN